MAFKIVNDTVIHNNTNVQVDDNLVLVSDGDPATKVLLQNVILDGATVDITQSIALIDTDDIAEGTTNLYFTDALAQGALASDIATLNTAITTGDATTLSTANAYTDTRETAITTAYQSYADAAVSSTTGALTTDDIAEASNLYYTDTRVGTYLTANSYANESYVDTAEVDAKAYTDTRETAITSAYTTAIANSSSSSSTTSNAYTDAEIASATTNLEAYTDTAVANVVDSAPAVLDTLNELAAALGDDANFATTVSNDLGTRVSKAGDTMAGALTLPGAPTNANHAATKSYVDTAYTAGNGLSLSGTEFLMSGSYTGDFTATGDVTAYSDRALKRNIETIENSLDKVMQMRGVTFEKDQKQGLGVIAQELELIIPEVVKQDQHGMRSVAYGNIVGVLIEAIKEQQKQIEELKSKIK